MTGPRRSIVIAATPTPNGDLHVGHLAGPYLSGDVYARYRRATGATVDYTTCTDDSQSYVVTTAARRGVSPQALCAESTEAIRRTVAVAGLTMPGMPPIDDRYRQTVVRFFTALHEAGRLPARTVRLPYGLRSGTWLYDALATGTCPTCLEDSAAAACEACGHPTVLDALIDPVSTLDPGEEVVLREHPILVLPLEDYRDRLTAYLAEREGRWRPHAVQLFRELLARPLPEVPVTVPGTWGVPAPFAPTPGQVFYPWVEAMPASMYATWWAAAARGERTDAVDEHWRAGRGTELVYFHGFDNVYHWALMDLALLMAHGDRYHLPDLTVCNEFYDLAGEKFSTSRGHLVWCRDLLAEVPLDLVRFHLTLTAPEFQRTDFTVDALRASATRRLVEPWNRLARDLALRVPAGPDPLPTTAAGRLRAAALADRFRRCYELDTFSTARAAETLARQLVRLGAAAAADGAASAPGDLLLEVRTLLAWSAPILVDTAARAAADVDLGLAGDGAAAVRPFALPPLSAAAPAAADRVPQLGGVGS